MTRLVIQIPCYNDAEPLAVTLRDLPRTLPGVSTIQVLVIDDGSTDGSGDLALRNGADFVVRHRTNRGLARAFMSGLNAALSLGADIIVTTDADHQYPGRYIAALIEPIVSGAADLAIGDRQPSRNENFTGMRRWLQGLGSCVVRLVSGTDAPDAASGFRAYSRYAALRMQVHNDYSYTLETLIQAGRERMRIAHVPIQTNVSSRPSKLHRGVLNYMMRQAGAIMRSYVLYQPLKTFVVPGSIVVGVGLLLLLRFGFLYLVGQSGIGRHLQSVSIGGTLLVLGILLIILGLLADGSRANRDIMQELVIRMRDQGASSLGLELRGRPGRSTAPNAPGGQDDAAN